VVPLRAVVEVRALVAERRVQQGDDVHGVAAEVDRHVDRDLDDVARQDAGRADGLALGARVRHGQTGSTDHNGTRAEGHTGRLRDARLHVHSFDFGERGCSDATAQTVQREGPQGVTVLNGASSTKMLHMGR
jgi:hypothetical protein